MPFSGKPGDTLFLDDAGDGHWYIILTKPNSDGDVVTVNFTTASHFSWLVVLRPRDNRRLFKENCTPNYIDARFRSVSRLATIAASNPKKYQFCDTNITMKIIIGAIQSQDIKQELLEELEIQYPREFSQHYR
jgi:hypothetical protein